MENTNLLRVSVTGAAGQISYSLLANLANGSVFGLDQPIILQLLDIEVALNAVLGVKMELEDCAFPLLKEVIVTHLPEVGFKNSDYIIMLGSMPRKEGMARSDLLKANVNIFKTQGKVIDIVSKKTVKVLVVGNPANTNALICQQNAPSIPSNQFSALTRLDQNRAVALISKKLNICSDRIDRVIIWGNHSNTQYPDISHIEIKDDKDKIIMEKIHNEKEYFENEFIEKVSLRGGEIIAARKLSSAMSASKAICDHIRDWHIGTSSFVSMAVISDGSYSVPKGLIFSFPVEINLNGEIQIKTDLKLSEFTKRKLDLTIKELENEKNEAINI